MMVICLVSVTRVTEVGVLMAKKLESVLEPKPELVQMD